MTHGAADLIPAGNKIARTIIAKRIMTVSYTHLDVYKRQELMSAIQTILGTILVFLFGLGIRNKFRMK